MMNINEINKILPQKFPFLMIDRVLSLETGKRLVALKNVSINEYYFQGHFPDSPVFPGALIIEAMAQSAILLYSSINGTELNQRSKFYLGSVKASFLKPVIPGDQLRLEAGLVKAMSKGLFVEIKAFVGEEKVAESELICMVQK